MVSVERHLRRDFLKSALGIGVGLLLLSIGVLNKLFLFFIGPKLTKGEELERREFALNRLRATLQEKQLELEREDSAYILVGALSDLSESTGRYFIDYQMLPAMAFKGADGLPHILSAKCTHLGCTVGNTVDNGGKLCCPCHMSYFDVKDGVPDPNSLAVAPLPRLGWTLMDPKGKVLISRSATGTTTGKASPKDIASANVYIARDAAGSMS